MLKAQQLPAGSIHKTLKKRAHTALTQLEAGTVYPRPTGLRKNLFFQSQSVKCLELLFRANVLLHCRACNDSFVNCPQNSERTNTLCVYHWDEESRHSLFCVITNLPFFTQSYYLQKSSFHAQTQAYPPLSHDLLTLLTVITLFLLFSCTRTPNCVCKVSHTDLVVSLNITPSY